MLSSNTLAGFVNVFGPVAGQAGSTRAALRSATVRLSRVCTDAVSRRNRKQATCMRPRSRARLFMGTDTNPDGEDNETRSGSQGGQNSSDVEKHKEASASSGQSGRSDMGTRDIEFNLGPKGESLTASATEKPNPFLEYIRSLSPPETLKRFAESAPKEVQAAMKQMVVNMLGNLPPFAYAVTITTLGQRLADLLYSTAMTGYMLRNAEYRLSLTRSLGYWSPNDNQSNERLRQEIERIAPDSVIRLRNSDGTTTEVPAAKFLGELCEEVRALKSELAQYEAGSNRILSYIRSLKPENLEQLTKSAGTEAVDAMKRTVKTLLEQSGVKGELPVTLPAAELSSLLFWLMVLGYDIREKEVKMDFERQFHRGYLSSSNEQKPEDEGSGPDAPQP
jgi:hypothetical protein